MARFIVTHAVEAETQEEVVRGAKSVAASLPAGVAWLNSWWVPDTLQLVCEWDAPDAEAVRRTIAPIEEMFPVETIHEVEWIDPQWYMPAGNGQG